MEKFRKSLRDLYTGEKISITPLAFIIRAVVKALKDYPNFNSSLDVKKEKIIYKKYYHVGIAIDTPHGLMVPKIRNADKKDITELGKELKKITKLSLTPLVPGFPNAIYLLVFFSLLIAGMVNIIHNYTNH